MLDDFLKRTIGLTSDELIRGFEFTGKIIVALVAIAYVLGLLIVNLYLRRFGFFSAGLLRVEYAMAGVLWLALFAFAYLLHAIGIHENQAARYLWSNGRRVKAIIRGIAALVVPVVIGLLVVGKLIDGFGARSIRDWNALIAILAAPAVLLNFADFVKDGWERYRRRDADPSIRVPIFNVAVQGTFLLTMLSWYAQAAYPRIHPSYGGGKPAVVNVIADGAVGEQLRQALLTQKVTTFDLIADAGDWLLLTPHESEHEWPSESRSAIRIRGGDVTAIVSVDRGVTK